MHSLIIFFPEILGKPDPEYFEFAWELLGEFVLKYPTTKSIFAYCIFLKGIRFMQLFFIEYIFQYKYDFEKLESIFFTKNFN